MRASLFGAAALFGAAVQGFAFNGPRETGLAVIPPDATTPRPTPSPAVHELLRRAAAASSITVETVLVGQDNTCGWLSGSAGDAFTCGTTDTCVLFTALWTIAGAVGCCDANDCTARFTCIDYDAYYSQSLCNEACQFNTFTLKCTSTGAPYCNTLQFLGTVTDYFCDISSYKSPLTILTTYNGEKDGRSFSTTVLTIGGDSTTSVLSLQSTATMNAKSTSSESSTSTSSLSTSASPTSTAAASSTPVGPIVGGVVGGFAAIGLIALGIFFLVRQGRDKQSPAAGPPYPLAATMAQQSPPPPPATEYSGMSYFDPSKQAYVAGYSSPSPNPGSPQYPPAGQRQQPGPYAMAGPSPDRNSSASPASAGFDRTSNISNLSSMSPMSNLTPGTHPGAAWAQSASQPQVLPTVYEAGGHTVGAQDWNANHHGQMHEMG